MTENVIITIGHQVRKAEDRRLESGLPRNWRFLSTTTGISGGKELGISEKEAKKRMRRRWKDFCHPIL